MQHYFSKTFSSFYFKALLIILILMALIWVKTPCIAIGASIAAILTLGLPIVFFVWAGLFVGFLSYSALFIALSKATIIIFAGIISSFLIKFYDKNLEFKDFGNTITFFVGSAIAAAILSIFPNMFLESLKLEEVFIIFLAYIVAFTPFFITMSKISLIKELNVEMFFWLGLMGVVIYLAKIAKVPFLDGVEFLLLLPLLFLAKRFGIIGASAGMAVLGILSVKHIYLEQFIFTQAPIHGSLFTIVAFIMAFLVSSQAFTMPTSKSRAQIPFEQLFENLPLPIYYKSIKNFSSNYNKSFEKEIGSSKKSVLEIFRQLPLSHKEEMMLPFDNGVLKKVRFQSKRIYDKDKNIIGSIAVFYDISEFELLHKNLQYWKQRYELALDGANEGLWDWDIKSDKVFFSRRWKEIMGYKTYENIDTLNHWLGLVYSSNIAKVNEELRKHLDKKSSNFVVEHALKNRRVWVRVRGKALYDSSAKAIRMVGYVSDITEEKHYQKEIKLFAKVFETTSEGVLVADSKVNIIAVNRAFIQMTGFSKEEVFGKNPRIRKSGKHDEDYYERLWKILLFSGSWRGEMYNRNKNNSITPERVSISVIRDNSGEISYFVAIYSDISKEKKEEERLLQLAHHDALTKLPNRYLFQDRLNQAIIWHKRTESMFGLFFIDLDDFKPINDENGHEAGDAVLKQVASRLRALTRQSDTVARLAGDEFVIILANITSLQMAKELAEKILLHLNSPIVFNGTDLRVGASIGISAYPVHGEDAKTLLQNADEAMYLAKYQGKNSAFVYGSKLVNKP